MFDYSRSFVVHVVRPVHPYRWRMLVVVLTLPLGVTSYIAVLGIFVLGSIQCPWMECCASLIRPKIQTGQLHNIF